jgi:hypothetical protein
MPSEQVDLCRDPLIADLEEVWPRLHGKPLLIDGLSLERFQHCQLLYAYRNDLVHEFRIAGRHVEIWNIDKPYYASLIEYRSEDSIDRVHSWELQYTAKFLRRLCASGLDNLEKYLKKNQIDPLESIDWGNYWIRELNQ